MILINNSVLTEVTIPVQSADPVEFHLGHHLSGQQIVFEVLPTGAPEAPFFTCDIAPGKFKYLGLYSLAVKNYLQETIYNTLATVSENKTQIPTYTKGVKNYELYK